MSTNCKGCPLDECPILTWAAKFLTRKIPFTAAGQYTCSECLNSSRDKNGIEHPSYCFTGQLDRVFSFFERDKTVEALDEG